jgi:hypothetical protein
LELTFTYSGGGGSCVAGVRLFNCLGLSRGYGWRRGDLDTDPVHLVKQGGEDFLLDPVRLAVSDAHQGIYKII